jgi:hypothetical protein
MKTIVITALVIFVLLGIGTAPGEQSASTAGDKIFILKGDAKQIEKYAGKKVSVTGEVPGNSLTVASIADPK